MIIGLLTFTMVILFFTMSVSALVGYIFQSTHLALIIFAVIFSSTCLILMILVMLNKLYLRVR